MRSITELRGLAAGRPVFIVGTGPSVASFPWEKLANKFTIALNDAIRYFTPDLHLFNDVNGADPLQFHFLRFPYDKRTKIVCQKTGYDFFAFNKWEHLDRVYTYFQRGPDVEPGQLWIDQTVSTGAIQLAIWMGASAIYLLGLDGFRVGSAEYAHEKTGGTEERTTVLRRTQDSYDHDRLKHWIDATGIMPKNGIWNLSEHSILTTWSKRSVEDVLRGN